MSRSPVFMLALFLMVSLFLLRVTAPAGSQEQANSKRVVVRGKLVKVAAIGGETTGWAIELDKPLQVEDLSLTRIEVLDGRELEPLATRRLEPRGSLEKRCGPERGDYWVLRVENIQTIKH